MIDVNWTNQCIVCDMFSSYTVVMIDVNWTNQCIVCDMFSSYTVVMIVLITLMILFYYLLQSDTDYCMVCDVNINRGRKVVTLRSPLQVSEQHSVLCLPLLQVSEQHTYCK